MFFLISGLSQALFEWRGFEILGKLSYGVFLLNIDVYNVLMALRTRLMPVSFLNLVCFFIQQYYIYAITTKTDNI